VPVAVARCVISRLTELVPNADHATPGWNNSGPQPVVSIGSMTAAGKLRKTQCGLCVVGDGLFLWANEGIIQNLCGSTQGWQPWRGQRAGALLRYSDPLACLCGEKDGAAFPQKLIEFLKRLAEEIGPSQDGGDPVVPREASVMRSGGPKAAPVVDHEEEADDPEVTTGASADEHDGPDEEEQGRPDASHRQESPAPDNDTASPPVSTIVQATAPVLASCTANAIKNHSGMLAVLRAVAIDRMRTLIPGFTSANLDNLILATGYPGAGAPGTNTKDLLFVMAASLANAAGGRPLWQEFAPAVVQAMSHGGSFNAAAPYGLLGVPTPTDLASWLSGLRPPATGWSPRMLRFVASATTVAAGRRGAVPLDVAMIDGMCGFCAWLFTRYSGNATTLNTAMAAPAVPPHSLVFNAISQLTTYNGIGVAIAANFLKDSQVPAFVPRYATPGAFAAIQAGWFAKPDLHVLRLMAKVSRGLPLHGAGGNRQKLRNALTSFAAPPLRPGPGCFPGSYAPAAGLPMECRAIVDIHDWGAAIGTSALEIERVLYLIGATRVNIAAPAGPTGWVNTAWYRQAEAAIDAALAAGIPRMS
jgi:hypothetical protein